MNPIIDIIKEKVVSSKLSEASSAEVEIRQVLTGSDLRLFIDFPHTLYQGDPNYVPEIYLAIKEVLSPSKNPFFDHSKAHLFLAFKKGVLSGRVAAIKNNNYNKFHQSNVGFFGFFDVFDDYDVAEALLNTVCKWNRGEGLSAVLGPTNLTTNDTSGLLISGSDQPPMVQMPYNKIYYARLLQRFGFEKEMDLLAYWIPTATVNTRAVKLADSLEQRLKRKGITIRRLRMEAFAVEVAAIKDVYQAAWEKNWGFVPPTSDEFDHLAKGMKAILDARFNFIAEHEGKIIGFAIGLPNINEILIKNKRGRLFPFGLFRLLWNKQKVKSVRIVLLGVVEEYRRLGIEGVFFAKLITSAKENGMTGGEASWVLENNRMMRLAAEKMNGRAYKTYRIYRKAI